MNTSNYIRNHIICLVAIFALAAGLLYSVFTSHAPTFWVVKGITKNDIVAAMGQPGKSYAPGEQLPTYGAYPPPPTKEPNQEVWVYTHFMKVIFVYFEGDRVRMVFITTT